jgi:large subunit ribosomal protein L5
MTPRLLTHYRKNVIPALERDLHTKNVHAVPRVAKVVLNAGFGNGIKDPKLQETVVSTLTRISGQKPLLTKSKKSISAFKIREGMTIGAKVTLRGTQMYEFLDKLINVALPRVRDFRGVSAKAFDQQGNYTLGFREHLSFPEIHSDEVEKLHGLEVIIATTAKNPVDGRALLQHLGFPFRDSAVSAKAQTDEQLLSKKQLVVKKKDK